MDEEESRPRQARAIATRRRLLDATIDALMDRGYAGASTTVIAKAAGVSQGALFKHFPSKSELLAAALEDLFGRLIAEFRYKFEHAQGDPISNGIRLLWEIFCAPPLQAAYELYVAARTDDDLREAIRPVVERHAANLMEEAHRAFPMARDLPEFDAVVLAIVSTMQGAAIMAATLPEQDGGLELEFLEHLARRELVRVLEAAAKASTRKGEGVQA